MAIVSFEDKLWREYLTFRMQPGNDETTDGMWCGERRMSVTWLVDQKMKHPKWAQEILDYRRSRMAEDILEVDKGLVAKAKAGSTQAASLLYARFEGWTPRVAETEAKKNPTNKTFAEMIAEASTEEKR